MYSASEIRGPKSMFTPAIDIFQTAEGLCLKADMPGVSRERLEVSINDNVLRIFGQCDAECPPGARHVYREYRTGNYYRSFILSEEVDVDRITAELDNGVLTLRLPRPAASKPRKIDVLSAKPADSSPAVDPTRASEN